MQMVIIPNDHRLLCQMAADNQMRYIKYTQTYKDKKGEMHDKMRD